MNSISIRKNIFHYPRDRMLSTYHDALTSLFQQNNQMFLNGFGRFFIRLLKCTARTLCEQGKDLSYLRYSLFRLHNPKQ